MKNNLERAALVQTTGAVASVSEQMAAGLWAAAEQFGISRDDGFPARVCTMAFGNGLHLGAREPEKARLFHEVLRQELPLPPASIAEAKQLACELCADGHVVQPFYGQVLPRFLESAGLRLGTDARFPLAGSGVMEAVAACGLLGLECWQTSPEMAGRWLEVFDSMSLEDKFLTTRLFVWVDTGCVPFDVPLIEFSCGFYSGKPKRRAFINRGIAETLPAASRRDDRWDLAFWSLAAWDYGRAFASDLAKVRELFAEVVASDEIEGLSRVYFDSVINVMENNGGRLDLLRSTLTYFANAYEGKLALRYCRGEQPRLLVQRAFDYAAWMGLLSAFPQQLQAHGAG